MWSRWASGRSCPRCSDARGACGSCAARGAIAIDARRPAVLDLGRVMTAVADKTYTPRDVAALCDEVMRLRLAIQHHKRRVVIDPQPWDLDLWRSLDA